MANSRKEILISIDEQEHRVAVLEDGRLAEIYIVREERQVGCIYKGRVANVLPGMNAAFIDIGLERNAFISADDISMRFGADVDTGGEQVRSQSIKDMVRVNQETLVQMLKESIAAKGARVTTYVSLPGRYLVFMPGAQYVGVSRRIDHARERDRLRRIADHLKPPGVGLIVRTAADGKDQDDLERDFAALSRQWEKIKDRSRKVKAPAVVHQELTLVSKMVRDFFNTDVDRLIVDSPLECEKILDLLDDVAPALKSRVHLYSERRPLFDVFGVDDEIEKTLKHKVWLDSGGYMIIDKTEALTVIDVNTGKFVGKTSLSATILKTNLEAAKEAARQLRLRDVGGIIVIDFIDMESREDQRKVVRALEEELRQDRTRTNVVGMTELGLVQITRKRVGRDLEETLRDICPYCTGRGRVFSLETMRARAEREVKRAALSDRSEAIKAVVHPRVAVEMLGQGGEDLHKLETGVERLVYLRADKEFHQERVEVTTLPAGRAAESIPTLVAGQQVSLFVEEAAGEDLQHGLAFWQGQVVEVLQGGACLGETVTAVVTKAARSYAVAEVQEAPAAPPQDAAVPS